MERLHYLDQMKGVAIFLMVMGHVLIFCFNIQYPTPASTLHLLNMPCFFYVSGFLAYKKHYNDGVFKTLFHKSKRLVYPWLFASIAWCCYDGLSFVETFFNFYWFFFVLWSLIVIFILYDSFVSRFLKHPFLYVSAFLLIVLGFAGLKMGGVDNTYVHSTQLFIYSISFLFGWLCKKYSWLNDFVLNNSLVFIISLFVYVFACLNYEHMNIILRIFSGIGGYIVLQSYFYHRERIGVNGRIEKNLAYLGSCTLSVYVLNNYFMADLSDIFPPSLVLSNGFLFELVLLGLITGIVIMGCLLLRSLISNNKYLNQLL